LECVVTEALGYEAWHVLCQPEAFVDEVRHKEDLPVAGQLCVLSEGLVVLNTASAGGFHSNLWSIEDDHPDEAWEYTNQG
jgi:hypothetical protein